MTLTPGHLLDTKIYFSHNNLPSGLGFVDLSGFGLGFFLHIYAKTHFEDSFLVSGENLIVLCGLSQTTMSSKGHMRELI